MSDKKATTKATLRFLARESFYDKRLYITFLLLPVSTLALSTAIPYLISITFANLAQGKDVDLQKTILVLGFAALIGIIANRIGFKNLLTVQAYTLERVQKNIMSNFMQKGVDFYANHMAGKLTSDAIGTAGAIVVFQDVLAINLIPMILTFIGGIVVVAMQSLTLAAWLLFMTLVVVFSAFQASRKRAPLRDLRHEEQRNLRGYFADIVTNNLIVKIFANESEEAKNHDKIHTRLTNARIADWQQISTDGNNRIIMILVLQILFVVIAMYHIGHSPELLGASIFAFTFTITLSNRLFEISTYIRQFENSLTEAAPIVEIFAEKPSVIDKPKATKLQGNNGAISFSTVSFQYSENTSKDTLFNNLNIDIKPGEKIGLVGHSGGGKSTITKMLLRFVDIQRGVIAIDGQNIADVTQESLRKHIAYVPQEPMLFHRSILENIQYGNMTSSKDAVTKAAKLAHAHEFIKDLPDGYDTLVGERGVKLSGGQRQRVAIARAMLKDAPILVLDEATSALDSESEVLIQDALWKLMEGKTAIVIAHRLSTIQKMDRIIVLEKGEIVEQGSHTELLKAKGQYAKLWAHQSGGFIEE